MAQENRMPNIILIMSDDLGYEMIGANGGTSYKTPVIDGMARTGMSVADLRMASRAYRNGSKRVRCIDPGGLYAVWRAVWNLIAGVEVAGIDRVFRLPGCGEFSFHSTVTPTRRAQATDLTQSRSAI